MTRRIDFRGVPATDLGARCVKSQRYKVRSGPNARKGTHTYTHTHTHTHIHTQRTANSGLAKCCSTTHQFGPRMICCVMLHYQTADVTRSVAESLSCQSRCNPSVGHTINHRHNHNFFSGGRDATLGLYINYVRF